MKLTVHDAEGKEELDVKYVMTSAILGEAKELSKMAAMIKDFGIARMRRKLKLKDLRK